MRSRNEIHVFNLPQVEGEDVTRQPLLERLLFAALDPFDPRVQAGVIVTRDAWRSAKPRDEHWETTMNELVTRTVADMGSAH